MPRVTPQLPIPGLGRQRSTLPQDRPRPPAQPPGRSSTHRGQRAACLSPVRREGSQVLLQLQLHPLAVSQPTLALNRQGPDPPQRHHPEIAVALSCTASSAETAHHRLPPNPARRPERRPCHRHPYQPQAAQKTEVWSLRRGQQQQPQTSARVERPTTGPLAVGVAPTVHRQSPEHRPLQHFPPPHRGRTHCRATRASRSQLDSEDPMPDQTYCRRPTVRWRRRLYLASTPCRCHRPSC